MLIALGTQPLGILHVCVRAAAAAAAAAGRGAAAEILK